MTVKKEESLISDKKILLIGDISKAFYHSSFVDLNLSASYKLVTMPSLGDAIGAAVPAIPGLSFWHKCTKNRLQSA